MNGPAQLTQPDLDLFQSRSQRAAPVRIGRALSQNAFALQLQLAAAAFAFRFCLVLRMQIKALALAISFICLLLFHGLAFPTLRHVSIVRISAPHCDIRT